MEEKTIKKPIVTIEMENGEIIIPVKMRVTRDRTERPHGASL